MWSEQQTLRTTCCQMFLSFNWDNGFSRYSTAPSSMLFQTSFALPPSDMRTNGSPSSALTKAELSWTTILACVLRILACCEICLNLENKFSNCHFDRSHLCENDVKTARRPTQNFNRLASVAAACACPDAHRKPASNLYDTFHAFHALVAELAGRWRRTSCRAGQTYRHTKAAAGVWLPVHGIVYQLRPGGPVQNVRTERGPRRATVSVLVMD